MKARAIAGLALALLAFVPAAPAGAHSGLVSAEPPAGATLGASPDAVRLTFSERPELSLARVTVTEEGGGVVETGPPRLAQGDPLAVEVPLPELARGAYVVDYSVVSAVDAHETAGTYSFGVRAPPSAGAAGAPTTEQDTSAFELVARWILLVGLVLLLGAAAAGVGRFAGERGTEVMLAAAGWSLAVIGLALLAESQRRVAGTSLGDLLDTPIGDSLVWRGAGIAVAGAGVLAAALRPSWRDAALSAAAIGALGAIVAHVEAGHAGSGGWPAAITVASQSAHLAAAGVWLGGLVALLAGLRGDPSAEKSRAIARFGVAAAGALLLILVTGTLRAVDELSGWSELVDTGYGRAVVAKVILFGLIVVLAMRNRRWGVPAAGTDLGPLRRTSRVEVALGMAALAAAAVLGVLAPPVAATPPPAFGIAASGSDETTGLRVELTAASPEPGPNTFEVRVEDGSGNPVDAQAVELRFDPLDDPDERETTLRLAPAGTGEFAGTGDNLAFDGRWGVTAELEDPDGDRAEVEMELEIPGPEQEVQVFRPPGGPTDYTVQLEGELAGYIALVATPEEPGSNRVEIGVYDLFENEAAARDVVVTTQAGDGPVVNRPVRRKGPGTFVAETDFADGLNTVGVVFHTARGGRARGVFDLEIPPG